MSYSNINDAFNINSKFENTLRSLTSFNPADNTLENISSGYNSNLNSHKSQYETELYQKLPHGNYYDSNTQYTMNNDTVALLSDNTSWESLNGTDLISSDNNYNKNIYNNSQTKKLTHRECINIYNNPDTYKDTLLTQALKHVSKCKICKDEIKNLIINTENKNFKIPSEESKNIITKMEKKPFRFIKNENTNDNINNNINDNNFKKQIIDISDNNKIENELKMLTDKINGETNFRYQNAMMQNNLSKYLEDLEEKKKINYKLDKIMDIVNLNLLKTNKLDNLTVSNEFQNNSQITPQILNNFLKLYQSNNNLSNTQTNTSIENYFLYISVFIIILLLIIDIILRFVIKSN
jgi:hypothetical protein